MKLKKLLPAGQADLLFFLALGVGFFLLVLGSILFRLWLVLVAALPVGYALFRIYSRNCEAREKENIAFRRFCNICKEKAKKLVIITFCEEVNSTRACPECGGRICVEEREGVFYTKCPQCGCRFLVDLSQENGVK